MPTVKQAERAIFEALRIAVVGSGYLPDSTTVVGATNIDKQNDWKLQRDNLKASLPTPHNLLIDVFGVAPAESRKEDTINRITIDRDGSVPGNIGGGPSTIFTLVSGIAGTANARYKKQFLPSQSEDISYEISYESNDIFYDRLMRNIIKTTLGGRKYIATYDDNWAKDGDFILIEFNSDLDKTVGDNFIRSARYTVIDLFDEDCVTLSGMEDMAVISTIDFQITTTLEDIKDLRIIGKWNADTNVPVLSDSTGDYKEAYTVDNAGQGDQTRDLGSGTLLFKDSDVVYHNGINWLILNKDGV